MPFKDRQLRCQNYTKPCASGINMGLHHILF